MIMKATCEFAFGKLSGNSLVWKSLASAFKKMGLLARGQLALVDERKDEPLQQSTYEPLVLFVLETS
jgi:hypothetical protein